MRWDDNPAQLTPTEDAGSLTARPATQRHRNDAVPPNGRTGAAPQLPAPAPAAWSNPPVPVLPSLPVNQ